MGETEKTLVRLWHYGEIGSRFEFLEFFRVTKVTLIILIGRGGVNVSKFECVGGKGGN